MDLTQLADALEDANSRSYGAAEVVIDELNQALAHFGLIAEYDRTTGEWAVYVA